MTLPNPASPLYERVKGYVLEKIGSGEWPVDHRLPSEHVFVEQFGVSRMTVHRALRELTAAGLIHRVQGVGTFVAPSRRHSALVEVRDIAGEIRARGHQHRAKVFYLEEVPPSPDLVEAFAPRPAGPLFHSLILHLEDDAPAQLEERFVNPDLAPLYLEQDFTATTTYEYLQKVVPMTEVEHVLSATAASQEIAEVLALAPGAPCLTMQRRTWSGAAVATFNSFVYPGARSSLASRYKVGER
ncbi:histidine utilization repressor [Labrys wisconsinensis]|uniref:Histidine utilization repressor n=1 Tax=Labrys wisconsinensis TaxID=425677 RepID=A0ABU0J0T4_9HYPH|nr:histidine utilization repressor [Labrys wisconsinensis]MDQ0467874.1 GntR family histidine utilization transcriptional repressor [Labrys wisconsinensis]